MLSSWLLVCQQLAGEVSSYSTFVSLTASIDSKYAERGIVAVGRGIFTINLSYASGRRDAESRGNSVQDGGHL
jgi:hypothetical protein